MKKTFDKHLAAREHLLSGSPLAELESQLYYGLVNLADLVSKLRRAGWVVEKRSITMKKLLLRINNHAVAVPPKDLPIGDIYMTEYWISK